METFVAFDAPKMSTPIIASPVGATSRWNNTSRFKSSQAPSGAARFCVCFSCFKYVSHIEIDPRPAEHLKIFLAECFHLVMPLLVEDISNDIR